MKTYLPYSLAFLWLWSAIQPHIGAAQWSLDLLAQVGIPTDWRQAVFYAASVLDLFFAIGYFTAWKDKPLFYLIQFATVAAYSLLIAFRLPEMWAHPFAPLIKNLPILALLYFLFEQKKTEQSK